MNKLLSFISDIFFPNRCPTCMKFIEWNKLICEECESYLNAFPDEICPECGKAECICKTVVYDRVFVCFIYEGISKTGILSLKDGHKEFGYYLGNLLGEKIADSNISADAVIPIPMSEESYKKRRYNQAEIIAERISEINNIPLFKDILYKNKSEVQHTLRKAERIKNTSAYCSHTNKRLDNMKVILCDDVITTGSTLNKCSKLLKEMGATVVYAAAGATTKLKKE